MKIGCTQMHTVTLVAIVIELILLGAQGAYYLARPYDRIRLWYIGLLLLMIMLNTVNGLLPDSRYAYPIYIQNIIVTGIGFTVASYYPLYFYKAFELKKLRFHAIYGIPMFMLLPYFLFFVVGYSIHEDIDFARRYGFLIPGIYSAILLITIGRSIHFAYRKNDYSLSLFAERLAAYIAMLPWSLMPMVVYYQFGQLSETLFANLGFMAVSTLLLYRDIRLDRAERKQLENLRQLVMDTDTIKLNCQKNLLSPREIEIAILLCHRLRRRDIADKLFISDRTVDKHTERIFLKMGVTSREELLEKLNTPS